MKITKNNSTGRSISALALLLVVFFNMSCGYQLQGSGSILPNDVKTISIRNAGNSTTVSGLGPRFTEKLRARFERAGSIKILESGSPADAELITTIVSVGSRNRDVSGESNVEVEKDLVLTVSAELRKKNGQILYKNPAITAIESFGSVSTNVVTTSSSFAQGNLGANSLGTLTQREVSRGQAAQTMEGLLDEAARRLYLNAVASDF